VIDPAILFWCPTDEKLPDTDACLKRAGLDLQTDHTALADARNVVRLMREGLKRGN
jgi:inhibitor of KinA sporulation pathway (predicted exonuclease)